MTRLNALHVLPQRNLQVGGPAYSVPRLVDALHAHGVDAQLWSIDAPDLGPVLPLALADHKLWPASRLARRLRGFSPAFDSALRQRASSAALVHNHGLWMFPNRAARRAAVAVRIPLVCSPRGMLEGWSLKRSRWSKALVWWLSERESMRRTTLFHATSEQEALSIRRFGLRQPIAVIANGVDSVAPASAGQRLQARRQLGLADDERLLLFMSRLHEKKGVLPLLEAWKQTAAVHPHWRLLLAGPDLDGYREQVLATLARLDLGDQVQLPGMLEGPAKQVALQAASAFVLPSHSENFGIVVAEAASAGLPVLTTFGTPWEALIADGGGWQVEPTVAGLSTGLRALLDCDDAQLAQTGERGRAHVEARYGWDGIGAEMAQSYRWLLQPDNPRPPWVLLD